MKKSSVQYSLLLALVAVLLLSCKKDGLNSALAKKIQFRWERISSSSTTDYLDGRPLYWTVSQAPAGYYLQFDNDGYFYDAWVTNTSKYEYKVDGDRILSLGAAPTRPTTPQYTDTAFINYVDDHLLVLWRRKYFISGAYSYLDRSIDSLKR
jgi:hypothetical protein